MYLKGMWRAIARKARSYHYLLSVDDAHELPILWTFLFKLHVSVLLGEQRMVAAQSNIGTGMKTGATLANDDVPCDDLLAAVNLDA